MQEAASSVLELHKITRRFGGLIAVDSVSLSVEESEIFGVIGPNGAGKTTLFNMITGLIKPSDGAICFQGKNITNSRPYKIAQKGVARTFQNLRLFNKLSVLENVAIAHHIHNRTNLFQGILGLPQATQAKKETTAQAYELLELVGLKDKARQQAQNLAYGDRRRLEIARALALKPKLLLLDEPVAGMNPNEKVTLSRLIRQIRDDFNLTILLIEHHVPLVMGLCDRVAVLNFGKTIALGTPETVKNDPAVIEAYLGDD
jgi:branched-chain amino acid transport system ATP-binding protein